MPTLHDFLDEMKSAGVVITGEAILLEQALSVSDWPAKVAELARMGLKFGVRFLRVNPQQPTDEEISRIVRGYNFAPGDSNAVADNTMLMDPDESPHALHDPAFAARLNSLREHFNGRSSS